MPRLASSAGHPLLSRRAQDRAGKTAQQGDKVEGGGEGRFRPEHKTATSPTTENTEVVGAAEARERDG